MKKTCALLVSLALLLSSCSAAASSSGSSGAQAGTLSASAVSTSDMFTDRDFEIGYDEETCARITLEQDTASSDSNAVSVSGSVVTISDEGTYLLSGTLDGMVIVDAGDADKVQLVLNGVEITSADCAAIYVRNADKVFLTTAADSVNTLSNGGAYEQIDDNNIDAVIFSKSDLTLNGAGSLTITAAAGHGVVSKDDLVVTSGTYDITAASHGLSGKDSVRIANGAFALTTGKDGVHAENTDDAEKGFVYLAGGTFTITAEGDGFSASSWMTVEDGSYTVTTGGGSANGAAHTDDLAFGHGGMQQAAQESQTADDTSEDASTKGFKAATLLTLNGGEYAIDAADDALHSNGDLTVNGGTYSIATGDDGAHADSALTVAGGTIDITESYEGLEGLTIDITGGDISIVASDDGLNAAGGTDGSGAGMRGDIFAATEGAAITISGGTLHVDASGDGIDSNGDLFVSGGEVYVSGPTSGGDGALDYNGSAAITGGVFIATGMSTMAQNFGSDSTQGAIMVTLSAQQTGGEITLTDASGTVLVSWQVDKAFDNVVVSCLGIEQGATYMLTAGSESTDVTMTELIYGSGSGMGGGRGGMGGGRGEMPEMGGEPPEGWTDDRGGTDGERPELPDGEMPQRGAPGEMPDAPSSGTAS